MVITVYILVYAAIVRVTGVLRTKTCISTVYLAVRTGPGDRVTRIPGTPVVVITVLWLKDALP